MTTQDQAIVTFVKANLRTVLIAAVTAAVIAFVYANWHNGYGHYGCDREPTTIGVIACHLS